MDFTVKTGLYRNSGAPSSKESDNPQRFNGLVGGEGYPINTALPCVRTDREGAFHIDIFCDEASEGGRTNPGADISDTTIELRIEKENVYSLPAITSAVSCNTKDLLACNQVPTPEVKT